MMTAALTLAALNGLKKWTGTEKRELRKFIGTQIDFGQFKVPDSLCTLVIYYDSAECSTCRLNSINEWDFLLEKYKNRDGFEPLYIFSPKKRDLERYRDMLVRNGEEKDIISDYKNAFSSANSRIPKSKTLHYFLIDADRKVVLAGDPLHNGLLWGLYEIYIDAICNNHGKMPDNMDTLVSQFLEENRIRRNGLVFAEETIRTGQTEKDTEYLIRFSAVNKSSHTIHITHVIPDCDCTDAWATALETGPGDTTSIMARFRIEEEGNFAKSIFVRTSGDMNDIELVFTGICK